MSIFYCNNKICCGGYEVEEDRSPFSHNKTQEIRIHRAATTEEKTKKGKKATESPTAVYNYCHVSPSSNYGYGPYEGYSSSSKY